MNSFDNPFQAILQSNEQEAMNQAYQFFSKRYEKPIRTYAYKAKVPRTEMDAIFLDTFLELVETIRANRLQTDCDSFIWTTVGRLANRYRTHQKTDYFSEVPAEYGLHDEISRYASEDLLEQLEKIVESLPEKKQQLIQDYLEVSTKRSEIAKARGEKSGTIRARFDRLLPNLKKLFHFED